MDDVEEGSETEVTINESDPDSDSDSDLNKVEESAGQSLEENSLGDTVGERHVLEDNTVELLSIHYETFKA